MADHPGLGRDPRHVPPLYQGFGSFVANLLLGVFFGWIYSRTGRVLPLVIAHFVVDAVVFVGWPLAAAAWPDLFGLPAAP